MVAFWESVDERTRFGATAELGTILRLPRVAPFQTAKARIARLSISAQGRAYLSDRCATLEQAYDKLCFLSDPVVLHGDANVGNLILYRRDRAVLSDLDSFCTGPAEWDLVLTGTSSTGTGSRCFPTYVSCSCRLARPKRPRTLGRRRVLQTLELHAPRRES